MINNSFKSLEIAYSIALKYITNFDEVKEITNKISNKLTTLESNLTDFIQNFSINDFENDTFYRFKQEGERLKQQYMEF